MKQAIIDIGSNSMRLSMYEVVGDSFRLLFKEKIMAGLAGYVKNGYMSEDGIECAYTGLLDFKKSLESLGSPDTAVFATASLRNIKNSEEAVASIAAATGYEVEIITGEEEALFGYGGVMRDLAIEGGTFVDIGGASTEIVTFDRGKPETAVSFPVGALFLFNTYVKKIFPNAASMKRIEKAVKSQIIRKDDLPFEHRPVIVGTGGTSRALMKIGRKLFDLPEECSTLLSTQMYELCEFLCREDKETIDLILKLQPDRIHTIVPGAMIMRHIFRLFRAEELIVSTYGVREGYLCQKILKDGPISVNTPKTES